jgi:hypothetical protein
LHEKENEILCYLLYPIPGFYANSDIGIFQRGGDFFRRGGQGDARRVLSTYFKFVLPMLHARQKLPLGGGITGQFVAADHPRNILEFLF